MKTSSNNRKAICLFSSAGIGELGLVRNGISVVLANELLKDRCDLYEENFPDTRCFQGDIRELKSDMLDYFYSTCPNEELFLIYATPPCQGMSSNSVGRLRHEVRQGNRPEIDERNRLILPAMEFITQVRPRWVLMENVPRMKDTFIQDNDGNDVNIMEYIDAMLGSEYIGKGEVISCSDYGVPQLRKRLITIYTRDPAGIEYFERNGATFFPRHEKQVVKTLRDAIGHLPSLDSRMGRASAPDFHDLHFVPVMKDEKYWWVSNTPEGDTAFNNQCVSKKCGYQGNALHRDINKDGRWQSNKSTPIYCEKCGDLLPRPSLVDPQTGDRRLIQGFHSAYRRMRWDEPARALTRNFQFEASDNKIHPDQNRVLSIYEALVLQTVDDYEYSLRAGGKMMSRALFSRIIGESVPPLIIDQICDKMINLSERKPITRPSNSRDKQLSLWTLA